MKIYTDEFKKAAVDRVDRVDGETRKAVAADLKISPSLITTWRMKIKGTKPKPGKQKHYSPAIRAKALKLAASGVKTRDIVKQLKITPAIMFYWKKMEAKNGVDVPVTKKTNGAAHNTEKRDVRDAMVFFHRALKIAARRGTEAFKDEVVLNLAYGVSLLEKKV
jgi:transposase-like protein